MMIVKMIRLESDPKSCCIQKYNSGMISSSPLAEVMPLQIIINNFPYINRFLTARRHAGKRRPCAGRLAMCEWRIYSEEMRSCNGDQTLHWLRFVISPVICHPMILLIQFTSSVPAIDWRRRVLAQYGEAFRIQASVPSLITTEQVLWSGLPQCIR